MRTTVSIPDDVFERAERLAGQTGRSRSEVFSAALAEYLVQHAPDEVTDAMDRVCHDLGEQADPSVRTASRRTLERADW